MFINAYYASKQKTPQISKSFSAPTDPLVQADGSITHSNADTI